MSFAWSRTSHANIFRCTLAGDPVYQLVLERFGVSNIIFHSRWLAIGYQRHNTLYLYSVRKAVDNSRVTVLKDSILRPLPGAASLPADNSPYSH